MALLRHGWPDDVRGWHGVAPRLHAAGFRTIAPYLRGFGPTHFRSPSTPRDGRGVALAHDAVALMDALRVARFAVVGHDWGARAAYMLAALYPGRIAAAAAISLCQGGGIVGPRLLQDHDGIVDLGGAQRASRRIDRPIIRSARSRTGTALMANQSPDV